MGTAVPGNPSAPGYGNAGNTGDGNGCAGKSESSKVWECREYRGWERLCREIRALQGLINSHRNIHGDAPRPLPAAPPRWNNPRSAAYGQRGAFSRNFQAPRNFHPRQTHSWRKKYSLDNRLPGSASEVGSASGTSRVFGSYGDNPAPEPPESSPERHVDFTTDGNIVVGIQVPQRAGDAGASRAFSGQEAAVAPSGDGKSIPESPYPEERRPSLSISFSSTSRTVCLPGSVAGSSFSPSGSGSESAVTLKSEPQEPLEFPGREPAGNLGRIKAEPPSPGRSCEEVKDAPLLPKLFGNAKDASLLPKLFGNAKVPSPPAQLGVTPGKSRFPVIPKSPVSSKAPKFRKTNYTWVANPGKSCRLVRRWGSPRAENSRKGLGGTERGAKTSPRADLGAKAKKSGLQSKLGGVSPSKYKWKASSLPALPSTSKSAFRWRCEDHRKPPDVPCPGGAPAAPSAASAGLGAGKSFGEAPLSSYKVKSRTKIIKRKGSGGFPTEKKNVSPGAALKSRFHLRRKNSARGKPSATPKRSSPRILVQVSRHRLRRIPAARNPQGTTKEGSNFPLARSPPSNKVIKTRYRIVKKNVATPASSSFSSPIPTWKTRRPGTSRSLLLNQTRPSPQGAKSQPVPPRWRSKGFRCIGGVLYRVSANKLSKTSSTPVRSRDLGTKTPSRAALRLHSMPSPGVSPSGLNRSSSCRYIASRAVQRSLAIIRQAKQRRKKKEYCMYYNRFGKCNRGDSCPYIHDPDKVAVCTRFLRGTCKKTDGTCPFSHKVSKDKMPVCSYYLKGICSNSNCPYSHVYVSRKAEVCQDFLKGYCPMGEKCKKKHTLVCPDFARKGVCPKGGRCKLLHPQKRRHPKEAGGDGDHTDPPSKWRWVKEEPDRNDPAQLHDDGEIPGPSSAEQEGKFGKEEDTKPTSCLQKLPSFISLRSPEYPRFRGCKVEKDEDEPEEKPGTTKRKRILPQESSEDSEDTRVEGARGKRLQIKPRL
ncbi:zinc finger CCCH domain-containing protein 3 isoform X1 [Pseudopipra pipra]|uniref:zinc finger CCCH domain-containing protein 3 isoform X1 n=1 Tax=Pseudopipra pipra TaxID=415032 RepID=UPI00313A0C1D